MTTIVCGVDHSPEARAAAAFAAELADRLHGRVVLVHAVQPPITQGELATAGRGTDWDVIAELRRAGAGLLEELER
jgi:nucleotide-binding universal stress UspA family protein